MLRLRRPRIALVLAVFTLVLLYHFKRIPEGWSGSTEPTSGKPPSVAPQQEHHAAANANAGLQATKPVIEHAADAPILSTRTNDVNDAETTLAVTSTKTAIAVAYEEHETGHESSKATKPLLDLPGLVYDTRPPPLAEGSTPKTTTSAVQDAVTPGPIINAGFHPLTTTTSTTSQIHWTQMPEHFPVPLESLIKLPTGSPKKLPSVQASFKDESPMEKAEREKRLEKIKSVFKKSWDGYTEQAWLHDELSPTSGRFRDPFCGWAATLVDSLDSLLILGMESEFMHALEGLAQIDFTTSSRMDIPLFETTIRYLGGLLSAYDLSNGQYKIILNKAVELADVLMGAFDTPNRMPQTYYLWKPTFAEQPRRAGTRVVMAELGSLSMEFTRLAQITKEQKYYDAIARITNEFEAWQDHTKLPGLFPLYVDASGCKKPDKIHDVQWKQQLINDHDLARGPDELLLSNVSQTTIAANPQLRGGARAKETPSPKFDFETNHGRITGWDDVESDKPEGKVQTHHGDGVLLGSEKEKRQLGDAPGGVPFHDHTSSSDSKPNVVGEDAFADVTTSKTAKVDCEPQGLMSPPGSNSESFTFSGMADSTYEYFPKQYALLGGLVPQYQKLYEKSIDAANKWLLFRPMTPNNEDILVLGRGKAETNPATPGNFRLIPELGHLLCFAGGMYGYGAKLFGRNQDLDVARQMTDACVWAYSITETGVMPEGMGLLKCDDIDACKWNQTLWEDELDPFPENRIHDGLVSKQAALEAQAAAKALAEAQSDSEDDAPSRADTRGRYLQTKQPLDTNKAMASIEKRNNAVDERQLSSHEQADSTNYKVTNIKSIDSAISSNTKGPVETEPVPMDFFPATPVSTYDSLTLDHAEYVADRARRDRLPIGVPFIDSRKYILRPEAIESVFYMYRITGDKIWRDKGWKMFEAVVAATDSTYGASAIVDVMESNRTTKTDEMESFWLAETLKYFYLLFATPDTISLDEYVLNTEAHPFKRPA